MLEKGLWRKRINLLGCDVVLSDIDFILGLFISLLSQGFLDELDILLGHLVHFLSHDVSLILLILGYFPDDAQEWGQLDLLELFSGFDSKDGRVVCNVQESLNHEVQSAKDEALSELLDDILAFIEILT
jgi:hypothetical protein